ncbi:MAG: hypothetical protein JW768_04160 [Chitinispirillaceae bacterium]|nr:hypothetical protein [Chitinispirillaceae bacterium]
MNAGSVSRASVHDQHIFCRGAVIRCREKVLIILAVSGVPLFCDPPFVLFSDSALLTCECPGELVSCAALAKRITQNKGVPIGEVLRNALDSLGCFTMRWDTLNGRQYRIVLGRRAMIIKEQIEGAPSGTLDSLDAFDLPQYYDAGSVKERTAQIARVLAERGYPFARVAVSINGMINDSSARISEPESLSLHFKILPDRKCLFAAPRLTGATVTKRTLLLRDVAIREGDLFDVRKIDATVEALGKRNYIAFAAPGAIAVEPENKREKNDSVYVHDVDYVSVPLHLKDRTGLAIEGAVGFSSQEMDNAFLQGDLTLSFLNVLHTGENASLLYAGDKTYQKFNVRGSKPWFLGYPLTGSASFGLEIRENEYAFLEGKTRFYTGLQNEWYAGMSMKGSETTLDSTNQSWQFYGTDLLLFRQPGRLKTGVFSSDVSIVTGGGIALRDRNYTRSHVDFKAGVHVPLWRRHAFASRLVSLHLITEEEILTGAEMYRVGGHGSARGYLDNELAFRTVAYGQFEYLYYYSTTGSVYIFNDNGFGFTRSLSRVRWGDRIEFSGYGIGLRIPSRIGILSIEWARNKDDDSGSFGRMHVQVTTLTDFTLIE